MTVYKRFSELNINLSAVGLIPGDTKGGYFCTPKGAKVIGWAGVDGIHYCFIKGMGEMVFAVDPTAGPGDYVHPLSRNFEDFLRLILACGDLMAVQQIYAWDKETFDVFLEENPVTKEQQAVLDILKEKLSLTPVEGPFTDVKTLQSVFDYDTIPFKREYYEGIPLVSEVTAQRKAKEWKVYFDGDFYDGRARGRAGTELPVEREFFWNGRNWYIPAVYVCGKGIVIDICIAIEPEVITAYYEKWGFGEESWETLSKEERRQAAQENPLGMDFSLKAELNGREQRRWSGRGIGWRPEGCLLPEEENTEEADAVMEHYRLDTTKAWSFRRISMPWVTKTKPVLRSLVLELVPEMLSVQGPRFVTPQIGESIRIQHPIAGTMHTLTVLEVKKEQFSKERFPMEELEFPKHFMQMFYTLAPDIPKGEYTIKDVCDSDTPRRKVCRNGAYTGSDGISAIGIIGGADGPTAVFVVGKGTTETTQVACSALRFEPAETVEWEMIFRRKPCEDIRVELFEGA